MSTPSKFVTALLQPAVLALLLPTLNDPLSATALFEGRLHATLTRGGDVQTFLYTAGTNCLRIERIETDWPHAQNLITRDTGEIILLFPHNRSFVRLKPTATEIASAPSGLPMPPPAPPGIGPQTPPKALPGMSAHIGPTNLPGTPAPPAMSQMPQAPSMPAGIGPQGMGGGMSAMPMPMMPMMPMERAELKATGETTNILGYECARYEIKQRGEVMEIWATDTLMPFQPYLQNQPPRFGPRMIEEQWGGLVKDKKLFPLLAVLKFENGPERLRFEVKTITLEKIEDREGKLFQPPSDYQEIQPLPF